MPAPDPDSTQVAPELLGDRYELLEPIGQGGMSTVYRARDRRLGRPVAVKVIRHDPAAHVDLEHLRERFRREAANSGRIPPHPNVVQIYDYGTDAAGHRDFIVMELLHGRDLKAVLRERRLGTGEAVRILLEAARGLAAGHRAGVVHRDVKPANLLLVDEGPHATVRVLDFGIAKVFEDPDDDLTRLGPVPHTPAYASPEQRGLGDTAGPASDVYQLGLIAFEVLAGERAFNAADRERAARGEAVPLRAGGDWARVPERIRAVVERSLRLDPAERYPDAGAFAEALAAAWEDDHTLLASPDATATVGPPPPAAVPATRGAGAAVARWRSIPGAVRVALVAVVAVILLWAVFRNRGSGSAEGRMTVEPRTRIELEETFAPLYLEAAERLAEDGRAENR